MGVSGVFDSVGGTHVLAFLSPSGWSCQVPRVQVRELSRGGTGTFTKVKLGLSAGQGGAEGKQQQGSMPVPQLHHQVAALGPAWPSVSSSQPLKLSTMILILQPRILRPRQ